LIEKPIQNAMPKNWSGGEMRAAAGGEEDAHHRPGCSDAEKDCNCAQ
jgi:hypothetical protein